MDRPEPGFYDFDGIDDAIAAMEEQFNDTMVLFAARHLAPGELGNDESGS